MQIPDYKEQKRLQDLVDTGIMDTLPEKVYDDIATLAAYICESPIAYISFLDDKRQWYKARINIPFEETSIEDALCSVTIGESELVHVPDLTRDTRFQSNAFVQSDMGIRFYAGIPLVNSEGSALGSLCVVDYKVRELTDKQRFALEALGRQIVSQLELRKVLNTSIHHALHDVLTGLPNRLLFRERLAQACREAKRHNEKCAVLFIDLDGFKLVNDTHGHSVGDATLKYTAERLSSVLREEDTVARYGGDEFVIILNRIKDAKEAGKVAASIQERLEKPLVIDGLSLKVGASVGISLYPEHATTSDELIQHADKALYEVKRSAPGTHLFFDLKTDL